jgi:folylpolyglutamate synthase
MECPRTLIAVHREDEQYEDAVRKLNGLQTNAAVLDLIRQQKGNRQVSEHNKMRQYLLRVGLTVGDLQQLKAIHVSGTKGKGSVCAITESILRCHGFKTGLYVSPHLLEVRERIRINGRPLSRKMFVSYFEEVYSKLHHTRHLYEDAMPSYFRFLTVMAFYVFLQSKVDVAVVEVGIGGTHDSTNIIEHPVVCGVTSLGYDHTDILGPTLADIAWHKGGICKEKCPVLTLNQSPEAMSALFHRARELRAQSFRVVPPLSSYPGPPPGNTNP